MLPPKKETDFFISLGRQAQEGNTTTHTASVKHINKSKF